MNDRDRRVMMDAVITSMVDGPVMVVCPTESAARRVMAEAEEVAMASVMDAHGMGCTLEEDQVLKFTGNPVEYKELAPTVLLDTMLTPRMLAAEKALAAMSPEELGRRAGAAARAAVARVELRLAVERMSRGSCPPSRCTGLGGF